MILCAVCVPAMIAGFGKDGGEVFGISAINLKKASKSKAELTLFITTTGDVRLETFKLGK